MLDLQLTEEQVILQRSVREFCESRISPLVRDMDTTGKIPEGVIEGLAGIGLLGMTVSTEHGGMGADPITVGVVAEELARSDISCAVPTFFLVQAAWGWVFDRNGREAAKRAVLPKVTSGRSFLGIATTEPDSGSDLASMKTRAEKSEEGYLVSGEKMFVSGVDEVMNQLPDGGGYLTLVKTDKTKGIKGISMLYIPLRDARGVSPTVLEDWGRRGISTGGFAMDRVSVPAENLVGEEGRGFLIAMSGFDYARAIISVVCCAVGMAALRHAMEYLKLRKAFGQPIGRFEGVQFKLAEHWAKLDAIRLLSYRALWMLRREQEGEKGLRFDVSRQCAEAKLLAAPAAFEAINDALQWFGAFGYTTECPLDMALKGVRSYFWAEGTLEIMKIIVARELLGKEYVAYR